jgi:phosphonatase-like hydrolase
MSAVELVVFDMAGTTIEHEDQVPRAFRDALRSNGIAFAEEELQRRMGASKREVLSFFVGRQFGEDANNPRRVERVYADFSALLRDYYTGVGVRPIAGVEEALARLRGLGIKVALTTGFDREVTNTILETVGWSDGVVDASLCGDDVPRGRPAPFMIFRAMEATGVLDVGRVAVVGDTALDLQAGTNAGARWVVGVLTGSHGLDQLGATRHTHILANTAELPALIEADLPGTSDPTQEAAI